MLLRGTVTKSREQIENGIEELGNNIECEVGRETTRLTMTVTNSQSQKAMDLLLDLVANSTYQQNQIESEKPQLLLDCVNLSRDQYSQTLDSVHATSYRDHIMGQPVLGNRDNINNLND